MQKIKHALKLTITLVALVTLSACDSGKKTITVDDSADYQGAITLQPLKRPSSPSVVVDPASQPSLAVEEPAVSLDDTSDVEKDVERLTDSSYESASESDVAPVVSSTITSEVINEDNGHKRLLINAEFDQAWDYLNGNIQTSDLTVFSRNKVAGRFAIGCGEIEAATAAVKKSGWSFFNREKLERLEYCALELTEKRGQTLVAVLNRSGVEVLGEYSEPVFERIFRN